MIRKKIALALAAAASAIMCVTAFASPYSDVPENHWAYSEIQKAGKLVL